MESNVKCQAIYAQWCNLFQSSFGHLVNDHRVKVVKVFCWLPQRLSFIECIYFHLTALRDDCTVTRSLLALVLSYRSRRTMVTTAVHGERQVVATETQHRRPNRAHLSEGCRLLSFASRGRS